jgi:MFS family permease
MMLSMVFASIISGQFISRTGKYRIFAILGFGVMAFGMFLASRMNVSTTNAETIGNMIVIGFGLGLTNPIFVLVVQNAFSHQQLGVVTSAVQFFGNVGSTIGIAVMGSVMNNRFATEMTRGIQIIPADVKGMIPPGILETLTSGNIQKINELVMRAGLSLQNDPVASAVFKRFEVVMKTALANSISSVFVFGILITVCGLLVSFFLREIPLRKSFRPSLEEAGMELAAETPAVMTVIRPDSEPDLVD